MKNFDFCSPTKIFFGKEREKEVGEIIKNTKRAFVGVGKLYDNEGNLLAEAEATYLKLPLNKISIVNDSHEDVNVFIPDDIKELEV